MTQHNHYFRVRICPKDKKEAWVLSAGTHADLGSRGRRKVIPAAIWKTVERGSKPGRGPGGEALANHRLSWSPSQWSPTCGRQFRAHGNQGAAISEDRGSRGRWKLRDSQVLPRGNRTLMLQVLWLWTEAINPSGILIFLNITQCWHTLSRPTTHLPAIKGTLATLRPVLYSTAGQGQCDDSRGVQDFTAWTSSTAWQLSGCRGAGRV